ncbi:S8 family serine peptidase [Pseudothermotoga sp.]
MKRFLIAITLVALFLAGCMSNIPKNNANEKTFEEIVAPIEKDAEIMENIVIVGYKDSIDDAINLVKSIDPNATIRARLEQIKAVSFKTTSSFAEVREQILERLKSDKQLREKISYVEPSYKRYLIEPIKNDNAKDLLESTLKTKQLPEEEEFWEWLWGIRKVKAPQAWELGYSGEGIIVAVVDTGVDGTHPDLQGQLVEGYRPLTGETLDPDMDSSFGGAHGTHVAGTIAAKRDGTGVVGVAPNAKIMPIVIFDTGEPTPTGEDGDYIGDDLVAEGFLWAAERGARIFSNSWGGKGYSITLAHTIAQIMQGYGGIFVASAGNSHTDEIHYPSCYPGVINVAASTAVDGITDFSTRGRWITVAAPGDFTILSTVPLWDTSEFFDSENPYAFYGGTSMATPHVSGLIALLLEKLDQEEVSYTPYQIRKHIASTADDIMAPGFDHDSGWGRVNAYKALTQNLPSDTGANVFFQFYVRDISNDVYYGPQVYVTMYPQSSTVPVYYGKSDDYGFLPFVGIEPGVYDVYMAFGDAAYLELPTILQKTHYMRITVYNGDNQFTHVFEFEIGI